MYESLLLLAVLWLAGFVFGLLENGFGLAHPRLVFQLYLVLVAGLCLVWQWTRGGQTLAMRTWRLRLVSADGTALTIRQATLRYFAALAGLGLIGAGFFWALFDRDRQFLHDRIAGTRIVRV